MATGILESAAPNEPAASALVSEPIADPQPRDPDSARSGWTPWLVAVVVLACGAPTVGFAWLQWDDPEHVTSNPLVLAPERVSLREQLLTPALGYPIPIAVASYRLEHALFGLAPSAFHAGNVLVHLVVCLLALRLARVLGLSAPGAAVAVLIFALHPASAEPVSWVTGRKDLLAAAFALAALLLVREQGRSARLASIACYGLGLLCKPVIAPLALLMPVVAGSPRFVRIVWPYLLVMAPIAALGVTGQSSAGALESGTGDVSRLRAALYAFGHHARLALLWEEPTAKYLPSPWPPSFPSGSELTAVLLLVLVALAALRISGPARRAARCGASFAALAYLPSSSLFIPLSRFLADSYLYLPLLGLGFVLGAALDHADQLASARVQRLTRAAPWLLALVLAPAFVLSSARFASDLALWSHARGRFPHHARVCREWSNAVLAERGPHPGLAAIDTCIAEFGDALFVKNRGLALAATGRYPEARTWLERAAKTTPSDPSIGRAIAQLKRAEQARREAPTP
jgi:protein O-mannosyl-transferase